MTEPVISPSTMVGQYNATLPTYTDGQPSYAQTDSRGRMLAVISNPATAPVLVSGASYASIVSFNRTNDTNVYAANDVIGPATGSTAAQTFASIGPAAGGEVIITTVQFEIDITAVVSGMTSFILYLYSVTPPSALGDNAAWDLPSGDRASFLGYVPLGVPVDLGSTLYVETTQINKQVTVPSGGSLFGYLVTVGTWTPAASSPFKITLHAAGF
jgi:hypothetical protein